MTERSPNLDRARTTLKARLVCADSVWWVAVFYLAVLLSVAAYQAATWPILAIDTDLWYHLNTGRYIVEHGALPTDAFHSFITPSPPWLDYFWLFQVLVYAVHTAGGYAGLVFLRATLFAGLCTVVFAYLRDGGLSTRRGFLIVAVTAVIALFLQPRYILVRPHTVSYFLIALFIYVLERKPRYAPALPLVAVLWVNLHGVMYPILLLIAGAFTAEHVIRRLYSSAARSRRDVLYLLSLAGLVAAVFVTPHGPELLGVPFRAAGMGSHYISGLESPRWADILVLRFERFVMARDTGFSILFVLALLGALLSLWKGPRRPGHLLLLAGGLSLLPRGMRFLNDFVLLALPMIGVLPARVQPLWRVPKLLRIVAWSLLIIVVLRTMTISFLREHRYPLSAAGLPVGAARFLKAVDVGGGVLNFSNQGGYLAWELYPAYKIFTDMQTPLLFSEVDLSVSHHAFVNPTVLSKLIADYEPDFIAAPLGFAAFKKVLRSSSDHYVPVFFDDTVVLYADASSHAALVEEFALRAVDPYAPTVAEHARTEKRQGTEGEPSSAGLARERELQRLLQYYPEMAAAGTLLGADYAARGEFDEALALADTVIANHPERADGYRLKADALMGGESFSEAVRFYDAAVERSGGRQQRYCYRRLSACHAKLGDGRRSYRLLKRAIDPFAAAATYQELYFLALSAISADELHEAQTWLALADWKVPPVCVEWVRRIRAVSAELQEDSLR
ncbi:hypothetical protein ACFL59_06375 [Planctomycetota bacterium]